MPEVVFNPHVAENNARNLPRESEPRFFGGLRGEDMERVVRLMHRLQAGNATETIRRISITLEALLDHQDSGGDVVLCRKGVADKVLWFL